MTGDGIPMIRPYDPNCDLEAVKFCIVELQEFERVLEPALPPGPAMAGAYLAVLVERCARHAGALFVAESEGKVVGFAAVIGRVEPEAPDQEQSSHTYVSDLVVLPDHRGRGIGRRLLERAETLARQVGTNRLEIGVLSKNEGAARLYRDFGFEDFRIFMTKRIA
ncbi:GNAT family N-acetyltransferase [Myxococcota bacterium]|nr:GNAT family N-acetyltransferase [Myxococcota bacterium]